jgi:hypothetical protein
MSASGASIGIVFAIVGLISILAGVYNWDWFWRSAQGGYLPNLIGLKNTRIFSIVTGFGMLSIGIMLTLNSLYEGNNVFHSIVGVGFSGLITWFVWNTNKRAL